MMISGKDLIDIRINGAKEIEIKLKEIIKKINDKEKKTLLEKIGIDVINKAVYKHFEEKKDPKGKSWEPVSQEYAKRKREGIKIGNSRRGSKNPYDLLILTRALYDSIHYEVEEEKNLVRIIAGDDTKTKKYAAAHNYGLGKLKGKARMFLGIGKLEKDIAFNKIEIFMKNIKNSV